MDRWSQQLTKTLRQRGLSRNQFSLISGVDAAILSRWMRGHRAISSETLERIERGRIKVETIGTDDLQALIRRATKAKKAKQAGTTAPDSPSKRKKPGSDAKSSGNGTPTLTQKRK